MYIIDVKIFSQRKVLTRDETSKISALTFYPELLRRTYNYHLNPKPDGCIKV
jgi:hypothetical protein